MAAQAALVSVRIGKLIPSLKAKPGDTIQVTPEQAASFKERRMLFDQVQEDDGKKAVAKMAAETERDHSDATHLRSVIDDQAQQNKILRSKIERLEKDLGTANAGSKALLKDNEELRVENASLRKNKGLPAREK